MKQTRWFPRSAVLLLAAPVLLTGCDSLQEMLGGSGPSAPTPYDYSRPAPTGYGSGASAGSHNASPSASGGSSSGSRAVSTGSGPHVPRKKEVTATTLADPVDPAVVHPKTEVAPSAVPLAAPSVGQ